MAYMSQEKKREIAKELKSALKGSGLRYSLAVRHHSTLVMTIRQGPVDFVGERELDRWWDGREPDREVPDHLDVNVYHFERAFTGEALRLLKIILPILNRGNFDNSDPMTDYFHVGWYTDINIGKWDKPYQLAV